jgi:hypothetical protein
MKIEMYVRDKKKEEGQTADYFLDWLNRCAGLDYKSRINYDESGDERHVDVYALSALREKLKLQIIISDQDHYALQANRKKVLSNTGESPIDERSIEPQRWVPGAIKDKYEKYSAAQREELVLIVQGCPWEDDIVEDYLIGYCAEFKDCDFQGIYFVVPLWTDGFGVEHKGTVIEIKPILYIADQKNILEAQKEKAPDADKPYKGLVRENT